MQIKIMVNGTGRNMLDGCSATNKKLSLGVHITAFLHGLRGIHLEKYCWSQNLPESYSMGLGVQQVWSYMHSAPSLPDIFPLYTVLKHNRAQGYMVCITLLIYSHNWAQEHFGMLYPMGTETWHTKLQSMQHSVELVITWHDIMHRRKGKISTGKCY